MSHLETSIVTRLGDVTLVCRGAAESQYAPQLVTAFERLDVEAKRAASKRVVVDLRDLEFATSSCLKGFVVWLIGVAEVPDGYHVVFQSNPRYPWQRRSLAALVAVVSKDRVSIELGSE